MGTFRDHISTFVLAAFGAIFVLPPVLHAISNLDNPEQFLHQSVDRAGRYLKEPSIKYVGGRAHIHGTFLDGFACNRALAALSAFTVDQANQPLIPANNWMTQRYNQQARVQSQAQPVFIGLPERFDRLTTPVQVAHINRANFCMSQRELDMVVY